MNTPQKTSQSRHATISRVLLVVAMALFFLAAITAAGADLIHTPMWAWGFGGFAAWVLAGAV